MVEGLLAVLAGILALFVTAAVMYAVIMFIGFLFSLITLPFSIAGMVVSIIQQKRGMGENGRTIAIRALIVGVLGAIALALIAFFMGATGAQIALAALIGLFLGAMFGL